MNSTAQDEIEAYVAAVRAALGDLRATAESAAATADPPAPVDRIAELRETALRGLRIADLRVGPCSGTRGPASSCPWACCPASAAARWWPC